ncbi:hypothetical protein ACNR9Q_04220 [Maribacter sp. X9]|uniref:hypothetical protein n=1 Tax=Maribacter sp. X9 TaxID=3402159 RepID=UPI003AF34D6B
MLRLVLFLSPFLGFNQFQTPEIFGEYGVFVDSDVDDNIYHRLAFGSSLFTYKFFSPEVDVSYYFGRVSNERHIFERPGPPDYSAYLSQYFDGFMWGFTPKLFYEHEGTRIVLLPKYSFGKIKSEGDFVDTEFLELEKIKTEKVYFWSFALGIEETKWSNAAVYGFYLTYSGLNAGKVLNTADFEEQQFNISRINTKTIGFCFRISYDFQKNEPSI